MTTSTPQSPADPTAWWRDLLAQWPAAAPGASGGDVGDAFTLWQQALPNWLALHEQTLKVLLPWWPGAPQAGVAPNPAADRRFADEAWQNDPRFAALAQAYAAQAASLQQALAAAPLDERNKAQMGFLLRQVIDALSPANSLATNPEAMQLAVESGGASLMEGMKLFMADLAQGRVSMTDDQAFEVGRNVATTPGSVIFENELIQLIQYQPVAAKVYARPLLIVPPCINKYYILDLQPENSLVAHALAQGHNVFLVSWRNIGAPQQHLTWDDYVEQGVIAALTAARDIAGADQVSALGFCAGGTLLSCALAVLAARGEDHVASLTLLTTLLDFSDTGELGLLVNETSLAAREAAIGQGGVLKGRELAQVFASLRANDLIWPYVVNGYLKGKPPPAFDLLFWNGDDSNLPGPMYCWYLRNAYLENKLRVPGATTQCGQRVDFGRITMPAFIYASREDHIVPWRTAYTSTGLLGGDDITFVLGASGHIAGVINPPAKGKRNHWVGKLESDAQAWLDKAQSVPGSWWPAWTTWLAQHGDAKVAAPKRLGNRRHAVIEPAPGRYVKEKAS
jgi:polyhydroxyalkanoate synthase subunit PhaC